MRLIKQVSLEYRKGSSDKVYEVDLCEVGPDRFVVNFRYGRRGSALREGSKTSAPVGATKAEQIFDELVASKTKKGYREASSSVASTFPSQSATVASASESADPRVRAVFARLAQGQQSDSAWRLSRAVWRAGEMRLHEAEPLLLNLVGSADAMLDYCIAWSLGQLGGEQSIAVLRRLEGDQRSSGTVRRIAAVALFQILQGADRQRALEECFSKLPDGLRELAKSGPADRLTEALDHLTGGDKGAFDELELLYLIDNEHTRPAVLHVLQSAPLKPSYFQHIRHIFKAAELRRDAEVFGLIAYRIETTGAMFRMRDSWYYKYGKRARPTLGADPEKAFSVQTRNYLRRRVWRMLKRLGELDPQDYVRLAAGVLMPFRDEDAREVRTATRYDWEAYRRSNWRNLVTINTHYDRYCSYWAFNQILYGNSPRYQPDSGRRFFFCKPPYEPGGAEPRVREESFPDLWQRHPEVALELIDRSRCELVHRFAVKLLRACGDFCKQLELEAVLRLLRSTYVVTAELGFELAARRYNPLKPAAALVLALANCAFHPARKQAHQWIGAQKHALLKQSQFIVDLIASPYADTREFAREVLRQVMLPESDAQLVIGRLIALLRSLGDDDGPLAEDICETLLHVFGASLQRIGPDVIRDLLAHELLAIQQFAGNLVLSHDTLSRQPPADILEALLESSHQAIRGIGMSIIGQLPDHVLKGNVDLLASLTRHRQADIRASIRPAVVRLARSDRDFGRRLARVLADSLLVPGAPEGVPSHTARVVCDDLRDCLDTLPASLVWKLLESRSAPAQEVGGTLLATNVASDELSVREIVKLAGHQILSVRQAAWKICSEQVQRMQSDVESLAGMLDSQWDDSRTFARQFFREHLADDVLLTPDILVGICDSVRPDVQQFGRELITRVFADDHGEAYVVKLSEHPSQAMQLFASNFLERHASDNPDRLRQLAPFFVSVLSRVNKGRVAKDRVLRFLENEALKSEDAARTVGEILDRLSATVAIGDKATAIEIMTKIHAAYPAVPLPIDIQPVEVRSGV